jgi:uncharacterized protein YcgI (DUF1989 family)
LTEYQMSVVECLIDGEPTPGSLGRLLDEAARFDAAREPERRWAGARPASRRVTPRRREALIDSLIPPASGAAIALVAGDTIRIEQVGDGQGVDLSVHELTGHGRGLSAGRTRAIEGVHPSVGATLWSTPPEVALLTILADTAPSHDLLFPACTPLEYEQLTGLPGHLSCSELHTELAAKCALGPVGEDDVLNLWLPTAVEDTGMLRWWPTWCRRGDRIDLRAERDVLVTLSTCPDDLFGSSQYDPLPVRVIVRGRGSRRTDDAPEVVLVRRPDPRREVEAELSPALGAHVDAALAQGWLGYTPGAVARALLFRWYEALGGRSQFGAVPSAGSSHVASKGQRSMQSTPTSSLTPT